MQECERVGIPYGVYLYSYAVNEDEANSEANHILRMLQGFNPVLGVYIDIEDTEYYNEYNIDPYSSEGRELITRSSHCNGQSQPRRLYCRCVC